MGSPQYIMIAKRIIGTLGLALMSVVLSLLFKYELGAPNYGLGVVIGVTLTCYLFGLAAAAIGFGLAVIGDYLLTVEVGDPSATTRLLTIFLTTVVTCGLVVLLQMARRSEAARNAELREVQRQLADALRYQRNIASTLQRAFLPKVPEQFGNVTIAASYEAGSAEAEIGGDFYDVLKLSDNELLIALGDVSGKGIEAARQASGAKYGLRSCILMSSGPAEALRWLNEMLCSDSEFAGFVTLFVGVLNAATSRLTYSNGGHERPILYRSGTGERLELNTDGIVVGAFPSQEYAEATVDLRQGDILLLYTDGLSEARNSSGMLGPEGLGDILTAAACQDARERLDRVINAARDYSRGQFKDDAAALLLSIGP